MSQTHNVISLDVGDRRIGVALASLEARIASPLLTLDRQEHADIFARIKELIAEHGIDDVVVGLPRGMEGQETQQTASARAFAEELGKASGVAIHMQDEAGTSLAAKDELEAAGKNYQKGDIDKLAAAYILQDWLETSKAEI